MLSSSFVSVTPWYSSFDLWWFFAGVTQLTCYSLCLISSSSTILSKDSVSLSFPAKRKGKHCYIQLMSDDVIPSNATENRLYGSLSCSSAHDFFYIDTDNIRQAIMILRPTTQKLYIFTEQYCWIFHPQVYTYVRLYKTALNLPFQSGLFSTSYFPHH